MNRIPAPAETSTRMPAHLLYCKADCGDVLRFRMANAERTIAAIPVGAKQNKVTNMAGHIHLARSTSSVPVSSVVCLFWVCGSCVVNVERRESYFEGR